MLPELIRTKPRQTNITTFAGLNATINSGIIENSLEFADMQNMSGDNYPALSPRKKRVKSVKSIYAEDSRIISNVLINNGKPCWIEKNGQIFFYGSYREFTDDPQSLPDEIQLYSFGNYTVIMPLKIMIKNTDFDDRTELEARLSYSMPESGEYAYNPQYPSVKKPTILKVPFNTEAKANNYFSVGAIKIDFQVDLLEENNPQTEAAYEAGENQGQVSVIKTILARMELGDCYEYVGTHPSTIYQCTEIIDLLTDPRGASLIKDENGEKTTDFFKNRYLVFTEIYQPYLKIYCPEGEIFKEDDFVEISGITLSLGMSTGYPYQSDNNKYKEIPGILNSYHRICEIGEDYIIIETDIPISFSYNGDIKLDRVMPDMDFMIENQNRLWGCSSAQNEIYCCRQGDPTNWRAYGDAISTDSYAATIGSEGEFTGIYALDESVLFFKENRIISLYGQKPSNFQISIFDEPGVEKGSDKSIVKLKYYIFYKSASGIRAFYPGSASQVISENAIPQKMKNAVAGKYKEKYYVSMQAESGEYIVYVYDSDKRLWHKEDNTRFKSCASYNNILYFVDERARDLWCVTEENQIEFFPGFPIINSREMMIEERVNFSAETGELYIKYPNNKRIQKIIFVAELKEKSSIKIEFMYDGTGQWEHGHKIESGTLPKLARVPFIPRRCETFKIRISGHGQVNIHSLSLTILQGSERNGKI